MVLKLILIIFCALNIIPSNDSYRILVMVPMPSKSHSILGYGVVRHLLAAGHEVVHVTAHPKIELKANYTEVSAAELHQKILKLREKSDIFKVKNFVGKNNIGNSLIVYTMAQEFHQQLLELKDIKKLLHDPNEKFDAVIIEWFFFDAFAGVASLLQCPLIWFSTTEAHWGVLKLIDEIPNPAYTADLVSMNSPPFSFWQRTMELFDMTWKQLVLRVMSEAAKSRGVDFVPYEDAVYNGSFMLINSHSSYGMSLRLPQNAKNIGGFHIETSVKALPKDLQNLMDKATNGVIYFSLGNNFRSSEMSDRMKSSVLKMFAELKQVIIWKFESDLENVPPNVNLIKWAPQQSILAHPNLKIFITHGGQLSTTEAIHHGVPVIGIPLAADQHVNMKSVTDKGIGLSVKLAEDLGSVLNEAVHKILHNPSYKNKAKEISSIYHDRPITPGKELVHWVEHVVKTRGAPHLRSPALMVSWYQKMYLDLLIIVTLISSLFFYVVKALINKYKVSKRKNCKKLQ